MTLTIDGRTIAFEGRPTLLEVARANGVFIPSLCDHPALEPYAACRLCLVEVKGRRGYVPACHTAAEDGLEVLTATPEIMDLRRGILELILVEHPHACLICAEKSSCDDLKSTIRKTAEVTGCVLCPENGHCELQKVVQAVGLERVHLSAVRRAGEVRRDDPFIDRDNSLCILCGRCVRVCHEVRGATVLTFVRRGSETFIGTALDRRLLDSGCRFCGACVDVCPTGSLSDRGLRYQPLPDAERPALCSLCGQGCQLKVAVRLRDVAGAVPDPEGPANRGQACVKGRFLVKTVVHHSSRLLKPMVRREGALREVPWEEALAAAAEGLARFRPGEAAVTASPQSSCEDLFVLHRFAADVLKAPAVVGPWPRSAAATLNGLMAAAGAGAGLNFRIDDLARASAILQLGEDLPATQPILGVAVHRAVRNGGALVKVAAPADGTDGWAAIRVGLASGREELFFNALAALVLRNVEIGACEVRGFVDYAGRLKALDLGRTARTLRISEEKLAEIGRLVATRKPAFILFGPALLERSGGGTALAALWNLALLTGARLVPLDIAANLRGALGLAAAIGRRAAKGAGPVSWEKARALYMAGYFPGSRPVKKDFLVVQAPYLNAWSELADVVLPGATSFETEGTFVNVEGRIQLTARAVEPAGEARPGWRIVADLAARMTGNGPAFASVDEVRAALAAAAPAFRALAAPRVPAEGAFLEEVAAGKARYITGAAISAPLAPAPDPDDYQGLALAKESKSLRLIRGR
ncbi:MAG TPA: molybdopterin-dependent oxidoreductase [Burkholderiales bacterium]|nr:molybdopterin-dependent oxidoreductase [Burkholderiales bacterium]